MHAHRIRTRRALAALPLLLLLLNTVSAQEEAIAVLDFDGIGIPENEVLALTNRLRNEIFKTGSQVVERGMMQDILAEQDFQLSGCTSNDCLVEVGQLLGATRMVGGSISRVGNTYTVSARLVDVGTGEVLKVADFDLRGEVDDMLTTGMRQVAIRLLGGQASPPAIPARAATPAPAQVLPTGLPGAWVATAGTPLGEGGYSVDMMRLSGLRLTLSGMDLQLYFNLSLAFRSYEELDPYEYYDDLRGGIGFGIAASSGGAFPKRVYMGFASGVGEYYEETDLYGTEFDDSSETVTTLGGQIRFAKFGSIALLADVRIFTTYNYGSSLLINLGLER